ncbi:MAG TPA: polyhydroxyalkanoate synthesis regulator DNA-binding domain-containing protein [Kofleriaceae bacterium]|nr:polyhydroxyalkanoate synthesis regulator DNA-binding domain-containing protein [Kofleriaceae bacterium]
MKKAPIVIKKYGNRRLYDTDESRYITLEELAGKIRRGADARVIDAKSGADLTQVTLTQIIIEGRGAAKLLPVPLLTQLIRLGDDALAEFFGRYVSAALGMYLQAKRGVQAAMPVSPFASMPFAATDALARMWMGGAGAWPLGGEAMWEPPAEESWGAPADDHGRRGEVADLRRELEELKSSLREGRDPGAGEPATPRRKAARPRRRRRSPSSR